MSDNRLDKVVSIINRRAKDFPYNIEGRTSTYYYNEIAKAAIKALEQELQDLQTEANANSISIADNKGITLRDYFAGQSIIVENVWNTTPVQAIADKAYLLADAMLEARALHIGGCHD